MKSLQLILVSFMLWLCSTALAAVHYVDVNNASPAPPYRSWTTAATNIQDAVDVAIAGDQILVTNGVYQTGARTVATAEGTNRVAVDKRLSVRTMNGPEFTSIDGGGAVRCVFLSEGSSLSGFTLTNGLAETGGGLWCESTATLISNCLVAGNQAHLGGGAF